MLVGALPAAASEPFSNTNVTHPSIEVNAQGIALVTYTMTNGNVRHVLVWGAINARQPNASLPQVRFKYDYSGGWKSHHNASYWKTFKNVCTAYSGPTLPLAATGCTAPDGSFWLLQYWQRNLPLLGFKPWTPAQTAYELHISHWSGALPQLTVGVHWTYNHSAIGVFGQFLYQGKPVYGFKSTAAGNPLGRYERNVYIDTHNSVYGQGWYRESGILTHNPTGTFCHSFVPQKPFPGYPSKAMRPAAPGDEYRFTVMGPGVTPVIQVTVPGVLPWKGEPDQVSTQESSQRLWDATMTADKHCASENGAAN
ncbi:MAG TPA: hypothetical protein VHV52_08340 [Gaiellaceae bacterium]|nr:hypothetical protein [Gaiellaceae bacterium]